MSFHGRSPGRGHGKPGPFLQSLADSGSTLLTGLVSWWDLDETSGTRVDAVGSNDLTDNNTVGYASGKIGNAADYVTANNESLSLASIAFPADYTISYWARATSSNPAFGTPCASVNAWAGQVQYQHYWSGNGGIVSVSDGTNLVTAAVGTTLADGRWYHYIASYDSSTKKITCYVNDTLTAESAALPGASRYAGPCQLTFGDSGGKYGSDHLDGSVDLAGLWSRVLTSDERTELYNAGAAIKNDFTDNGEGFRKDLVAYYKMEETSGTRVNSAPGEALRRGLVAYYKLEEDGTADRVDSHSHHDLTPTASLSSATGKNGDGCSFDGTNYLEKTGDLSSSVMDQTTGFTWNIWYKSQDKAGYDAMWADNYFSLTFYPATGGSQYMDFAGYDGAWKHCSDGWVAQYMTPGTWYMLTCVYDEANSEMRLYRDGSLQATESSFGPAQFGASNSYPYRIGRTGGNRNTSVLDEHMVWDRVLSQEEITALHASGSGKFYPFSDASVYDLADVNTVTSATGISGNAASFVSANSERLSYASGLFQSRIGSSSFSVSAWLKKDDTSFDVWMRQGTSGSTTEGFTLFYESPNYAASVANGTNEDRCNIAVADPTGWTHIVYVYNHEAGTGTIYANGSAGTPVSFAYTPHSCAATVLYVGGFNTANSIWWDGEIDECFITDRVLSAGEIAALYASGSGRFYNFAV